MRYCERERDTVKERDTMKERSFLIDIMQLEEQREKIHKNDLENYAFGLLIDDCTIILLYSTSRITFVYKCYKNLTGVCHLYLKTSFCTLQDY